MGAIIDFFSAVDRWEMVFDSRSLIVFFDPTTQTLDLVQQRDHSSLTTSLPEPEARALYEALKKKFDP